MDRQTHIPLINNTEMHFSPRDCLGIESVAASISGILCPIVNTVTPRAFYWPFMAWIYYDFYTNSGITEHKVTVFDEEFLKRQDYFFVLSTIIDKPKDHSDQINLVGKEITSDDYKNNPDGPYPFNLNYFKTTYGGMQYYNAGCLTMHFTTNEDEKTGKTFSLPRLTQYGEEMARAFEAVIKDTAYYTDYRLSNDPVPKKVLEEYGNVINMGLRGFDECKRILRKHLFEMETDENMGLRECADYLRFIHRDLGKTSLERPEARNILFNYYSSRGMKRPYPSDLQSVIAGWEIVVGRHYFTCGIEMIWKHMLLSLTSPMTFDQWAETVIEESSVKEVLNDTLNQIIEQSVFSHDEYEAMIANARQKNGNKENMVLNGLKIALSLYNRFKNREDLGDSKYFLNKGEGDAQEIGSLSFNRWIEIVEQYKEKTVGEFLIYVMKNCIVEQHKRTCFEKIMRPSNPINGYYFECVDDMYIKNEHEFQIDFQGIRLVQLMQVMTDLDMFEMAK